MRQPSLHLAHSDRRPDLQGVRGYAVTAVVLFHFFPSLLPMGYLGVDMFFVLSGFLISMVLDRCPPFALSSYLHFYYRRIKRIVPLFLLITCSIIIFLPWFLDTRRLLFYNTRSAVRALMFMNNANGEDPTENYFRQVTASSDFFTHTWSLSVEIQFYLIVPFLLLPGKLLVHQTGCSIVPYLFVVFILSLYYHLSSDAYTAFHSTFARIWQFMSGAIVYALQAEDNLIDSSTIPIVVEEKHAFIAATTPLLEESENERKSEEHQSVEKRITLQSLVQETATVLVYAFPVLILTTTAFYCFDEVNAFRLFVTLSCALVLHLSPTLLVISRFCSYKIMIFLGDISYVLYLVHWPIVCLLGQAHLDSPPARLIGILACLIISSFLHEFYEKPYLKWPPWAIFSIIVLLYAVSFAGLHLTPGSYLAQSQEKDDSIHRITTWDFQHFGELSIEQALKINEYFEDYWYETITHPECTSTNPMFGMFGGLLTCPMGHGSKKFLVIGNSYALNQAALVMKHFRRHYSTLQLYSQFSCEPLLNTSEPKECLSLHSDFLDTVKQTKPDVLFIIQRFMHGAIPLKLDSVCMLDPSDSALMQIMENIEAFAAYTKKIFVLNALPTSTYQKSYIRLHVERGTPFGTLEESISEEAGPMRLRMAEVAKRCTNCFVYDVYQKHIDKDGNFMVVDPRSGVEYFEASSHYTPYGLYLIEPVYEQLSANFTNYLSSKYPNNVLQ